MPFISKLLLSLESQSHLPDMGGVLELGSKFRFFEFFKSVTGEFL
jgi:hypothetical protein